MMYQPTEDEQRLLIRYAAQVQASAKVVEAYLG